MRARTILLGAVVVAGTTATAAWADHPEVSQMPRVLAAAHDLEKAAHHVRENVDRHHRRVFQDLEKKAKHFHRQVERYRSDPRHTEDDFDALVHAYDHAVQQLHHMDHHVQDDFRGVEASMHALMDFYGYAGHRARKDPHGR